MSRIAEFHAQMSAFNTMFADHFLKPIPPFKSIDETHIQPEIEGVTFDVYYKSGEHHDGEKFTCSYRAEIDGTDLFPLLSDHVQEQIENACDKHFFGWNE